VIIEMRMYRTKRGKHLPLFAEARLRLGGRVASTAICGVYYFNRKVALAMVRSAVRLAISEGTVVTKATLRAASLLAISNRALARIVGVSEATVSRMGSGTYTLRPDEKPFELAVLFIRFYRALDAIVHGDDKVARAWLINHNEALGDAPLTVIQSLPGLMHAVAYLDARRALV